jgi:hypothetical protein
VPEIRAQAEALAHCLMRGEPPNLKQTPAPAVGAEPAKLG